MNSKGDHSFISTTLINKELFDELKPNSLKFPPLEFNYAEDTA